jgi:hypothetical protein
MSLGTEVMVLSDFAVAVARIETQNVALANVPC